jgi:hypothetical protein
MITVDITQEEEKILCDMLEGCIEDLRTEILDTDRNEYKDMLKKRKLILQKIFASLSQAVPQET